MKLHVTHFQHLMIGLFLSSCAIFGSKKPPQDFTQTNEIKAEDEIIGCDLADVTCSQPVVITPYVCRASADIDTKPIVLGWGDSLCLAKRSLMQNACKTFQAKILDDEIECLPDPSQGECQYIEKATSEKEIKDPTVCFARNYNKIELTVSNILIAWGESSEDATYQLKLNACANGLKPSLIGNIECHREENKQCPPKENECDGEGEGEGEGVPVYCQVEKLADEAKSKPWISVSDNECQAKFELQKIACNYVAINMLKHSLNTEDIICQPK